MTYEQEIRTLVFKAKEKFQAEDFDEDGSIAVTDVDTRLYWDNTRKDFLYDGAYSPSWSRSIIETVAPFLGELFEDMNCDRERELESKTKTLETLRAFTG